MANDHRAFIPTRIRCSPSAKQKLITFARERVTTTCTDRVVDCLGNELFVRAECPSPGSKARFVEQMRGRIDILKAALGGRRKR